MILKIASNDEGLMSSQFFIQSTRVSVFAYIDVLKLWIPLVTRGKPCLFQQEAEVSHKIQ